MYLFTMPLEISSSLQFLTDRAFFSSTSRLKPNRGFSFFNKVKKLQNPYVIFQFVLALHSMEADPYPFLPYDNSKANNIQCSF